MAKRVFPGASYAIGVGGAVHIRDFGGLTYGPKACRVGAETIWDLASITKVVATTTAVMILHERGLLDLDEPVGTWVERYRSPPKDRITVRHLLLHNSGNPASHPCPTSFKDPEDLQKHIFALELQAVPGTEAVYSDVGFIVLAKALEACSNQEFGSIVQRIFGSLGLEDTVFNPGPGLRKRCAPTEPVEPWREHLRRARGLDSPEVSALENGWITGEVHDPTAFVLGGVAGSAGLFSSSRDIGSFMAALLDGRIVKPSTLRRFTTRGPDSSRALGWDTPSDGSSAGARLGTRSFGHTGFTGTSVWVDPDRDLFVCLLTNRVHPSAENLGIKPFRIEFIDAVVDALSV